MFSSSGCARPKIIVVSDFEEVAWAANYLTPYLCLRSLSGSYRSLTYNHDSNKIDHFTLFQHTQLGAKLMRQIQRSHLRTHVRYFDDRWKLLA